MARKSSDKTPAKKGRKRGADADQMSNWVIAKFVMGILLVFLAIFMLISFASFLYCGAADYSMVEMSGFDEFYKNLTAENIHARNVCGAIGARTAFVFINNYFGIAAFFIPVYMIFLGLKLIGSFRIRAIRTFIMMGLVMIWLSWLMSAVTIDVPALGNHFYYLGGYSGMRMVEWANLMIGTPGVYGILAMIAIFVLLYLSKKTVDVVRNLTRLERIKAFGNPLRNLMNPDTDAAEKDDDENDELNSRVKPDPEVFDDPETQMVDFTPDLNRDTDSETSTTDDLDLAGSNDINDFDAEDSESAEGLLFGDELKPRKPRTSSAQTDEMQIDLAGQTSAEDVAGMGIGAGVASQGGMTGNVAVDFDTIVGKTQKAQGPMKHTGDISTPYDPKKDLEFYKYPALSLLDKKEDQQPKIDMEEQNANKENIIRVLHNFGVEIKSIKATIGPTITLYEIIPAEGTKISKIRNLEDDIALSLAAMGIRIIAPIPGKGTIGIEVPNKQPCIVSMESILNSRTYQESKMELPCAIGKTITNEVFMVDLAKAPHMLVAGATGMGKSVGLNAIITSLLYKKHPAELKIVMVDPKKVEFSIYNPIINHFLAQLEEEDEPIITDVQKVVKTLNSLCKLMDTRYDLLKHAGVRNIKEYNAAFQARKLNPMQGHDYMPYYVVVIDEFGDLIMTAGKEIELPICRIAQLARAVGIHMIIATQRPTAQIITGTIKANFPARIAFRVSAMMDSRIILDRPGANQLIGKGDLLYLNGGDPTRVQCAFVDTPEVKRICQFISTQQSYGHPAYLPEPDVEGEEGGGGNSGDLVGKLDPMFEECARLIVTSQQGSTSMLQRNFGIGYNRAGKLMDQMQKAGIVGAQIGSKPRDVLVQDFNTLENIIRNLR